MLCLFFRVAAQENNGKRIGAESITQGGGTVGLTNLQIGDRVPDVLLRQVWNNGGKALRLADFRGKLLVIDFWSTFCSGCIWAMPHLDSLQAEFRGRVVILPVAFEKKKSVAAFWKHNEMLKGLHLPSVVEDRQLQALFPHRLLPHDVWIDRQGRVMGFTTANEVTAEKIRAVLSGRKLRVPTKRDVLDYDREKPLLVDNNGGSDSGFRYRSVITGYLPGLPASLRVQVDSVKRQVRVKATNVSPIRLYSLAYRGLAGLSADAVGGEAKEVLLPGGAGTGRDTVHAYCYELILPGVSVPLARRSIREDLDRFFGVRTAWDQDAKRLSVEPLEDSFYHKESYSLY